MRRWNVRLFVIAALALVLGLSVACSSTQNGGRGGGGGAGGGGGPGDVSVEDIRAFADAYQTYEQALQGGLEERECDNVADEFAEVSEDARNGMGVPEALFNAGMVWDKCGNTDNARNFFEQANKVATEISRAQAKANPKAGAKASPGYAPALIVLGAYSYRKGEGGRGKAKQYFDQAREADRRSCEAYTNLGILEREREQWSEAQLNLRRALAVNSDFMTAFAQMALLYLEVAEDNEQMLDIVELVSQQATGRAAQIKADPLVIAPIHNIWGLALIRKGDVVRAVEQFDAARRLNPEFFEAHMNSGAVTLSFRGFEAAREAFSAATKLQPDNYQAHLSLGAALRGLEQYDQARAEYEKARQLDAAAPGAYYNLAVLMHDYEMATAGDMGAQIKLLGKAKGIYRQFLNKCQGRSQDCVRQRPGQDDQDMRAAAEKRIKACDATVAGLREAQELAAEVAQMEAEAAREAQKAPPPPPTPPEGAGGEGG